MFLCFLFLKFLEATRSTVFQFLRVSLDFSVSTFFYDYSHFWICIIKREGEREKSTMNSTESVSIINETDDDGSSNALALVIVSILLVTILAISISISVFMFRRKEVSTKQTTRSTNILPVIETDPKRHGTKNGSGRGNLFVPEYVDRFDSESDVPPQLSSGDLPSHACSWYQHSLKSDSTHDNIPISKPTRAPPGKPSHKCVKRWKKISPKRLVDSAIRTFDSLDLSMVPLDNYTRTYDDEDVENE